MFEKRDRWLEELLEYTNRKELITCTSGHMPLTAITEDSRACALTRSHMLGSRFATGNPSHPISPTPSTGSDPNYTHSSPPVAKRSISPSPAIC